MFDGEETMTSRIVQTATRALCPFMLLYGLYIILFGHVSPGGGFQGGAILAMAALLLIITFGRKRLPRFTPHLVLVEIAGVTAFVLLGVSGMLMGHQFLTNFDTIPMLNILIGVEVFAGVLLMYIYLFGWKGEMPQ